MSGQYDDLTYMEDVYAALFELLEQAQFAGGLRFNSTTRSYTTPDDDPPADQPALILVQGPASAEQKQVFGLTKWTFTSLAVIYARVNTRPLDQSPLPTTIANYLIWGMYRALAATSPPYQKQTISGIAYHAWVEGEVTINITGDQLVLTLPIYILPE